MNNEKNVEANNVQPHDGKHNVLSSAVNLTEGQIAEQIEKDNDEDDMWDNMCDDDDFEPCSICDLPDACQDFGCALKQGIRRETEW